MSELMSLQAAASSEMEKIAYPDAVPGLRKTFVSTFGSTGWTERALDLIRKYSGKNSRMMAFPLDCIPLEQGIVEIGCGSGQWSAALRLRGADVIAVDDMSDLPDSSALGYKRARQNHVMKGNELVLRVPAILPYISAITSFLGCINEIPDPPSRIPTARAYGKEMLRSL